MPSSTFNFERQIPRFSWSRFAVITLALTGSVTAVWETAVRSWGYRPTLNDTHELWAKHRRSVKPDSIVIIGDSRALFDLDLDEMEKALGRRPVQLAMPGTCAYPVLEDLVADPGFHGTVVVGMVPLMFFVPGGPLLENAKKGVKHYRTETIAQELSGEMGMFLEEHLAFLKQEDLTLGKLLEKLPIPNRSEARVPPRLPPYFATMDRSRRARMVDACAFPGPLQTRVKDGWPALFSPPPPPKGLPREVFAKTMKDAVEKRFADTKAAVSKLRARGGKVVFVRFPVSGKLREIEDAASPRSGMWSRVLRETQAPGIYYEDYSDLSNFECPEWSHLSGPDSVEFTRRLLPRLKKTLGI